MNAQPIRGRPVDLHEANLRNLREIQRCAESLALAWPQARDVAYALRLNLDGIRPRPQGSHRGVVDKRTGRVVFKDGTPHSWRSQVSAAANMAKPWQGGRWDGPAFVVARFRFSKPKSSRDAWPSRRSVPDLDKLERAVGDALELELLTDDARVVTWLASKVWHETEGVDLLVVLTTDGKVTTT